MDTVVLIEDCACCVYVQCESIQYAQTDAPLPPPPPPKTVILNHWFDEAKLNLAASLECEIGPPTPSHVLLVFALLSLS